jgi:hypothetical protein
MPKATDGVGYCRTHATESDSDVNPKQGWHDAAKILPTYYHVDVVREKDLGLDVDYPATYQHLL